ncbi:hypothetical protein [Candidatus Mycobacterium methanotrophicum]|uniref:NlpC/P60 domain-containing protein n=1 Tax=Candidatus Mycobacterium methanotrophicum TaxID=2943498 RepID=A0ABY4QS78_9MYCO|nr:hypothetical protein [Candidatus Mycobacterium methanotrophicum]UQX13534.1 hypothetical protein M5I08_25410 [Candidatus Mycobacterium methanotrophicum]
MSLDDLLDPGDLLGTLVAAPIFGPAGMVLVPSLTHLFQEAGKLFGSGGHPNMPAAPKTPPPPAPTNGQGPTQDQIDKVTKTLTDMQKQIEDLHKAGEQAAKDAAANSAAGRDAHAQILRDGAQLGPGLDAQGGTPESDAGRLAAVQQQIDELRKNVQDKAGNANGIADGLRNLGTGGLPGLGGGSGLGIPGLGGLGGSGLSPLGGSGLGAPAPLSSPSDGRDPLKPADLTTSSNPLQPSPVNNPNAAPPAGAPTGSSAPPGAPGAGPAAPPAPAAPPPGAPPTTPAGKDVTLPSGTVVTARTPQGATAVRQALTRTADSGDVATAAYAGTGVNIPTDGADPGRKVDPADVKPGDIAVCADHTAIVAGNGQLIGPDGKLQPLGVINDWPDFKGFFDPTATADAPDQTTGATPTAPPLHSSDPTNPKTTTLASPAAPPEAKTPPNPGFGMSNQPSHEH